MNLDSSDGNTHYYSDTAFWGTTSGYGVVDNALTADFKSDRIFTADHGQLMIMVHQEGTILGWRVWTLATVASLEKYFGHARSHNPAPVTIASMNSSVSGLDSREVVVRPNGTLMINMVWGASASPDWARVRNSLAANTDNQGWGLGIQMDAQNNGGNPYYPACDAATTAPWDDYFCIGDDRLCTQCGASSSASQDLQYDYAIYVK